MHDKYQILFADIYSKCLSFWLQILWEISFCFSIFLIISDVKWLFHELMLIWQLHCRSDMHWQRWYFRWKLWCEWEHWFKSSSCQALFSHAHFITTLSSVRFSTHELIWWEFWLDFSAAVESACWTSWIFWTDELNHTFLMQKMSYNDEFNSYIDCACS